MVAQLAAFDEDFTNSSPLEYAIVDGNEDAVFGIDPIEGLVTVIDATSLKQHYKLKVNPIVALYHKFSNIFFCN